MGLLAFSYCAVDLLTVSGYHLNNLIQSDRKKVNIHGKQNSVISFFRQDIALSQIPYKFITIFRSLSPANDHNITRYNQLDKILLNCYDMNCMEEKDGD
jgi:hypothetical protein